VIAGILNHKKSREPKSPVFYVGVWVLWRTAVRGCHAVIIQPELIISVWGILWSDQLPSICVFFFGHRIGKVIIHRGRRFSRYSRYTFEMAGPTWSLTASLPLKSYQKHPKTEARIVGPNHHFFGGKLLNFGGGAHFKSWKAWLDPSFWKSWKAGSMVLPIPFQTNDKLNARNTEMPTEKSWVFFPTQRVHGTGIFIPTL